MESNEYPKTKRNAKVNLDEKVISNTTKPNRANKRKLKNGSGCKMCKPHKGKWEPFFKNKERQERRLLDG